MNQMINIHCANKNPCLFFLRFHICPSSILVASNTIRSSSTTSMLTIILLALFVNLEATRRPAQTGQPATTTLITNVPYEGKHISKYISIAKSQLESQLKRNKLPYIEMPDCKMMINMAKEAKRSNGLIKSASVKCGKGPAKNV
ncbi:unnamed protein product [Cylicocyclus nassatus]|uniref:Uncharacterized protein n=1 Tax=Cylicocyclus nassatus TaxID=53992 RepID=A0AA36M4F7_CYLNA|nr:unnamed protein product [Cylicocyclus nassatus]